MARIGRMFDFIRVIRTFAKFALKILIIYSEFIVIKIAVLTGILLLKIPYEGAIHAIKC
jgi:hypothetical protein